MVSDVVPDSGGDLDGDHVSGIGVNSGVNGGNSGSGTRSKGITLNLAVSPMVAYKISPCERTETIETADDSLSGEVVTGIDQGLTHGRSPYHCGSGGIDDGSIPIPPVAQLETWDIDAQLRLLALKEMAVVEIKDSIAKMQRHLQKNEADLHQLREIIQRSLYKELTVSSTPQRERNNSNPREEAIANTRSRRSFSLSNSQPPLSTTSKSQSPTKFDNEDHKNNPKIWNGLSKPLHLLLQLDTMLQNEFEKSLTLDHEHGSNISPGSRNNHSTSTQVLSQNLGKNPGLSPGQAPNLSPGQAPNRSPGQALNRSPGQAPSQNIGQVLGRKSEDSVSSVSTISPLKHKSSLRPMRTDYDKLFDDTSDDIFQSVSTSLWSFVNDVKTNVLSSLIEEQEGEIYSLENGSSISLDKMNSTFPKITQSVPVETVNNSDYEDGDGESDGSDEKLDLSMYANLRKRP